MNEKLRHVFLRNRLKFECQLTVNSNLFLFIRILNIDHQSWQRSKFIYTSSSSLRFSFVHSFYVSTAHFDGSFFSRIFAHRCRGALSILSWTRRNPVLTIRAGCVVHSALVFFSPALLFNSLLLNQNFQRISSGAHTHLDINMWKLLTISLFYVLIVKSFTLKYVNFLCYCKRMNYGNKKGAERRNQLRKNGVALHMVCECVCVFHAV